jgi:hypothetical protein
MVVEASDFSEAPQDTDLHCRPQRCRPREPVRRLRARAFNAKNRRSPLQRRGEPPRSMPSSTTPFVRSLSAFCPATDVPVVSARLASTPLSRQFLADQACDACALRRRLAEKGSARRVTSKSGQSADPAVEVNSRDALLGISMCHPEPRRAGDRISPCNSSPP